MTNSALAEYIDDHADEIRHHLTEGGIIKALLEARREISNPKFDAKNPHFGSNYVSLYAVLAAVNPIALKHGIIIVQDIVSDEDRIGVETTLFHEGGESMRFGPAYFGKEENPHRLASATTYARRYCLMAIFGLVGIDEDDDGNAAALSGDVEHGRNGAEMTRQEWEDIIALLRDVDLENGDGAIEYGDYWTSMPQDKQALAEQWRRRYYKGARGGKMKASIDAHQKAMALYRQAKDLEFGEPL